MIVWDFCQCFLLLQDSLNGYLPQSQIQSRTSNRNASCPYAYSVHSEGYDSFRIHWIGRTEFGTRDYNRNSLIIRPRFRCKSRDTLSQQKDLFLLFTEVFTRPYLDGLLFS